MQSDSNNPYSPPPIPPPVPSASGWQPRSQNEWPPGAQPPGFGGFAGMQPHRGGLILGLGVGGLGSWLVGCVGGTALPPCGLLGLVGLGLGIAAWVMGASDMRAMREGRMDPTGLGNTKAGKICGMITVILVAIGVLITVIMLVFFGAVAAAILGGAAAGAAGGTP